MDTDQTKSWQPHAPSLTPVEFRKAARAGLPLAVFVWAEWSIYDRKYDLTLRRVAAELNDCVQFFSSHTSEDAEWLETCPEGTTPILLLFVAGKKRLHIVGEQDCLSLIERIKAAVEGTHAE